MNVFQKMMYKVTPQSVKNKIIKDFSTQSNFSSWIGKVFFGIENDTLATNENIFSVVSRLSNTLASLPFKLYKEYDVQYTDAFDRLYFSPNANQTLEDVIRALEVSRNTNGNGYALIMRDIRAEVEHVIPLDPNSVEPLLERETHELWYRIRNDGRTYFIHHLDMIHVKHISLMNSWKGISPIQVLKNSNQYDKAVREFALKEMQNTRDSFILKYAQNVDEDKRKEVVEDFKRFYEENGGVLFQEPGVEVEKIMRDFIAGDMKIAEEITRDRIANVYNIPSIFLNSNSDSFSSNEQLMQMFVNLTLIPIVRQYEKEFNRKILSVRQRKEKFYFKFSVNGLLRGDSEARSNYYSKGLRNGWLKVDDIRAWEDLPPEGGMAAQLWISGDMYPLEMDPTLRKNNIDKTKSGES